MVTVSGTCLRLAGGEHGGGGANGCNSGGGDGGDGGGGYVVSKTVLAFANSTHSPQ